MQSDSRTLLTSQASGSSSSVTQGKPDRLYVGNLSPTVDEYTLIQVFQKYGKITKLDFMFHKTGVLKGKPRGYAFVEFANRDDALKAMVKLHDRLLRGRKLVVTSANSATPNDTPLQNTYHNKGRRGEPTKTTTLSLLKQSKKPQSAAAQIAAMEAKLAALQSRKPADEDYVPGQGIDSKYNHAQRDIPTPSGSGSPSPAPQVEQGMDVDLDEELGLDAAVKAANDLEREFGLEIAGRQGSADPGLSSRAASASAEPESKLPQKKKEEDTKGSGMDEKEKARQEAFKRGLAGLPKKPSFT